MKALLKNRPRNLRRTLRLALWLGLVLSLVITGPPAPSQAHWAPALCGEGAAPTYGFTTERQQAHWTVDLHGDISAAAINEVDVVLDALNAEAIAQTMMLILPAAQVGNRVNCAVHFLRYMQLGLPTGERKDNGFVFLIVVEAQRIDVHYGVGLGLPALTAAELTPLNRAAEAAYQETGSLDVALLTLVQAFDTVARNNYAPLVTVAATPEPLGLPTEPQGWLMLCGLLCFGAFFLLFLLWGLTQLARGGITFNPSSGSGSRGLGGFPLGGGRSIPSTRGGSGSGRSGRGN